MRKTPFLILLFFLLLFSCQKEKPKTVSQIAKKAVLPTGAPKYSDICFSSRWEHPRNETDTLETFPAAASFHATYINWVYTTNPEFIQKAKKLGYKFQVALSPIMEDLPFGSKKREKGRILTADGNPATAPWMQEWEAWWGCVNHPDFRQTYLNYIKISLDAGAESFQVDDPAMASVLVRNEWEDVCYCEYCRAKADSLGLSVAEIQDSSVLAFHRDMKKEAAIYAGKSIPFSCNNFRGEWALFPYAEFDYGIAEVPIRRGNPEYVYASIRETRLRQKAQVFSFVSDKTWLVQKMIATTYAAGGNLLVPWDVWQGGGKPRYFGSPEDYAPYYGFVKVIAPWLDGYEDAFYTSTQIDTRYQDQENSPISFEEYRLNTHAFVRAKPNDSEAPVVIHLIDWEVLVNPFTIYLQEALFFENGIETIELLQAKEYDESAHSMARENGAYSDLVAKKTLEFKKEKGKIVLEIPKLERHWGVLIIKNL